MEISLTVILQFWEVNGQLPTILMYTDGTIHFTDIYLRNNQRREIVRKKEREREREN